MVLCYFDFKTTNEGTVVVRDFILLKLKHCNHLETKIFILLTVL